MKITQRVKYAYDVMRGNNLDKYFPGIDYIGASNSGIVVTQDKALQFSAFFNALQIISQSLAMLPLIFYKRIGDRGKTRYKNHHLYNLFQYMPNPEMNAMTWKEMGQLHLLLRGNFYNEIEYDQGMRVKALWPLNPAVTKPFRDYDGEVKYKTQIKNRTYILPAHRVFHIPGFGYDGHIGYSILRLAKETIGLGLAAEQHGAKTFGKGTILSGVLETEQKFDGKGGAAENLRKNWEEAYSGLKNSHRVAILEQGLKFKAIGMDNEASQFLQTRVFTVEEVARWFNLPPHMLKDLTRSTYSNIAVQDTEFVKYTMLAWFTRWEMAISTQLLTEKERVKYFTEFLIDALLRGDTKARYEALHIARMDGIMNANEWRAMENMNPQEGDQGDVYTVPMNMMNAKILADEDSEPDTDPDNDPDTGSETDNNLIENSLSRAQKKKYLAARQLMLKRSLSARRRISNRYKPRFKKAIEYIVNIEKKNIMKIAEDTLSTRDQVDFKDALEKFYEDNRNKFRNKLEPVHQSFSKDIYPEASKEIGSENEIDPEFEKFVKDFTGNTVSRYIGSSQGQLNKIVTKAVDADEDPVPVIEARLEKWEDTRPEQVASREIIDGESRFSQFVYFAAGLRSVWITTGESTCPYCLAMAGKTIGKGQVYFNKGDEFEPGDADGPMKLGNNVSGPSLHGGCDCASGASII